MNLGNHTRMKQPKPERLVDTDGTPITVHSAGV